MKHRILRTLLAGAAALALTATAAAPAMAASPVNRGNFAAIGDSIAAGDGVTVAESYPALLAGATNKVSLRADSGATTDTVLTQVMAMPANVRQVTVTVGMNDLNWVQVVAACAGDVTSEACQEGLRAALLMAEELPARTAAVVAAVKARAPEATVYVTGYPKVFQPTLTTGDHVCPTLPFEPTTLLVVDVAIGSVNDLIEAGVVGAGAEFVSVDDAFAGKGLCGTDSYIQGMGPGDVPLHPNAEGQKAYFETIVDAGFNAGRN